VLDAFDRVAHMCVCMYPGKYVLSVWRRTRRRSAVGGAARRGGLGVRACKAGGRAGGRVIKRAGGRAERVDVQTFPRARGDEIR
jgi:hypothetical protein